MYRSVLCIVKCVSVKPELLLTISVGCVVPSPNVKENAAALALSWYNTVF